MVWGLLKGEWSSDKGHIGMIGRKAVVVVVRWPSGTNVSQIAASTLTVADGPRVLTRGSSSAYATYVLQLPDKFTPRRRQTRPYASTK